MAGKMVVVKAMCMSCKHEEDIKAGRKVQPICPKCGMPMLAVRAKLTSKKEEQ